MEMEMEREQLSLSSATNSNLTKSIRCIVKLGGAAVTCKNDFEKINEENLVTVCSQLRLAMMLDASSEPVLGMDWSKRPGVSETPSTVDDYRDQLVFNTSNFVVVHGAGSFGHFQASKSGVHRGGLNQPFVKAGFVATRISVTSLNLEIVRALARGANPVTEMTTFVEVLFLDGIPSIGMSPFPCGWSTCERKIASADVSMVAKAIDAGFIPVLHGDAVLDESLGCTILSGDVIISHLAAELKPEFVVFLTDVFGVYDRPPTEPSAVLLKEIAVREDGSWSVVNPTLKNGNSQVDISVASHDTTGGMATKISEAAMIAKLGIDVYIVKVATKHSLTALSGKLKEGIPEDWLGTVIRFAK